MSKQSVFCLATSRTQAEFVVEQLHAENFSSQEVSVLFADRGLTRDLAPSRPAGTGGAPPGRPSGIIGGALGWVAGIGAIAVPGAGPLIAGGPLAAALTGFAAGAGMAGGLLGLGLTESEARRYEVKIKQGNLLISVHTERGGRAGRAKEIFVNAGAQEIGVMGEVASAKLEYALPGHR